MTARSRHFEEVNSIGIEQWNNECQALVKMAISSQVLGREHSATGVRDMIVSLVDRFIRVALPGSNHRMWNYLVDGVEAHCRNKVGIKISVKRLELDHEGGDDEVDWGDD
jgi:hypothetical protein